MLSLRRFTGAALVIGVLLPALTGCEKDAAQKVGEDVDRAMDEVGEVVEKAADDMRETADSVQK
ncbi:MAG: hypothetical protein ABR558_10150 [Thioalkalivibrio sp.]